MSWVRIWIHIVFSTKNREPFLQKAIREDLCDHIKENSFKHEIWLDSINGYSDHIHCLISIGREQTISKVAQLIKGESSFWLNKNHFFKSKFRWQDDFWAVSVSESHLKLIRNYIDSQEEHHKKRSLSEEVNELMVKYRWSFVPEK